MRPWIYVAGPYTKPDPSVNTRNALLVGMAIWRMGGCPIVPHLTHLWHLVDPQPYEHWLDYDRCLLRRCDAITRIKGESPGADKEIELMRELRKPVLWNAEQLAEYLAAEKTKWLEEILG